MFLQDAYASGRWLLIGGNDERIPIRVVPVRRPAIPRCRAVPTDQYYACLDGDWNAARRTWG
jgi:hypothetical protein